MPVAANLRVFVRPQISYKSSSYDEAEDRLGLEADHWSITGWGTNLNDNRHANYLLRYVDYGSFNTTFFGPNRAFAYALPDRRMFGVEARYKF